MTSAECPPWCEHHSDPRPDDEPEDGPRHEGLRNTIPLTCAAGAQLVTKLVRFDTADGAIATYHLHIDDNGAYAALPPLSPAEAETLIDQLQVLVAVTKTETGPDTHRANGHGS